MKSQVRGWRQPACAGRDYQKRFLAEPNSRTSLVGKLGPNIIFPLSVAGVTAPCAPLYRDGNTNVGAEICDRRVQFLVCDIERLAFWAPRLRVVANARDIEILRDWGSRIAVASSASADATWSLTQPIRFDQNQSKRTMLSSSKLHSIPADSRLPLASNASGRSRNFRTVTKFSNSDFVSISFIA